MLGVKPKQALWAKVNQAILNESAADVFVTCLNGFCQILIQGGICPDENHARAHIAAMLLSPDTNPEPGSLLPMLKDELARLNDGKWIQ